MADDDLGWDGPVHGRVGVLAADGERVQCHVCGGWFANLGQHATFGHGLDVDEYRRRFGLKATTGLVGSALRAALARRAAARKGTATYARFQAGGRASAAGRAPRGPWSLEERLDPARRAAQRANLEKAWAALRERRCDSAPPESTPPATTGTGQQAR